MRRLRITIQWLRPWAAVVRGAGRAGRGRPAAAAERPARARAGDRADADAVAASAQPAAAVDRHPARGLRRGLASARRRAGPGAGLRAQLARPGRRATGATSR